MRARVGKTNAGPNQQGPGDAQTFASGLHQIPDPSTTRGFLLLSCCV